MGEKLFYKIGEVSHSTGLEPYVLRYWETEFPMLRPRKSRGGQRTYMRREIDIILKIKQMLYQEGYTIQGARRKLRESESGPPSRDITKTVARIKADLQDILKDIRQSS